MSIKYDLYPGAQRRRVPWELLTTQEKASCNGSPGWDHFRAALRFLPVWKKTPAMSKDQPGEKRKGEVTPQTSLQVMWLHVRAIQGEETSPKRTKTSEISFCTYNLLQHFLASHCSQWVLWAWSRPLLNTALTSTQTEPQKISTRFELDMNITTYEGKIWGNKDAMCFKQEEHVNWPTQQSPKS